MVCCPKRSDSCDADSNNSQVTSFSLYPVEFGLLNLSKINTKIYTLNFVQSILASEFDILDWSNLDLTFGFRVSECWKLKVKVYHWKFEAAVKALYNNGEHMCSSKQSLLIPIAVFERIFIYTCNQMMVALHQLTAWHMRKKITFQPSVQFLKIRVLSVASFSVVCPLFTSIYAQF